LKLKIRDTYDTQYSMICFLLHCALHIKIPVYHRSATNDVVMAHFLYMEKFQIT